MFTHSSSITVTTTVIVIVIVIDIAIVIFQQQFPESNYNLFPILITLLTSLQIPMLPLF